MLKKIILLSFILMSAKYAGAQGYPDTLWMPVTFYDFHLDKSNPEFECAHDGGVRENMVANTLDADRKPVVGSDPYMNYYIKYWYRDWNDSAKGDYTIPKYNKISGGEFDAEIEYDGIETVDYDTAFINMVFEDSLPFKHIGNGVYEYKNNNFFPLDGRGYGNESQTNPRHNFAFTMELHTTFIMKPGLTFNFTGDDDVWAFVDNKLEMDIGSIHEAATDSFKVDSLGLIEGEEYNFDFFFAERHTTESHIWITTNIVSTHIIKEITIQADPPDAIIQAGDSVNFTGSLWYDSTANDTTFHLVDYALSENITWSFVPADSNSSLTNSTGSQTSFTSTEAYETFTVTAAYEDPSSGEVISAQMVVTVLPGPADHLVIEASPDTSSLDSKQNDQPLDTITIGPATKNVEVYAILRDLYGNFVDYSKNTQWNIVSGDVIASAAIGDSSVGEGVITKHGPSGTGGVSATDLDYTGPAFTDSITVIVQNDPPVANNDTYTLEEDNTLTVPAAGKPGILDNDTDPDTYIILTAELVTDVTEGTLSLNSDGSFTYVPPEDFNGNAVFTYKAYDGELYSNEATVTIIVGEDNDPPIAVNDTFTIDEDSTLTVSEPGVLANDTDIEGDPLTALLIEGIETSEGSLTFDTNGSFIYIPATDFNGTVTFTYQAFDGMMNSNIATVTITVNSINDIPVANDDSYSVNEDNTLSISVANGVIANDTDNDGDPLTASLVSPIDSSEGTLEFNSNGSFTYTPVDNFNGVVTFTYLVNDGSANSNTATVTITVNSINDAPIGAGDSYYMDEDDTLIVSPPGVLSNDTDNDQDALTAVLVNGIDASEGTLDFNEDGSFTYIPIKNLNGTITFTYRASDGTVNSSNLTVMIFVLPVNDAPVANNDAYSVKEDSTLTVSEANGILANDNDIDEGDELTVILVSDVDTGELILEDDGSFTFIPEKDFNGAVTFTYMVFDGTDSSNVATVTILVGEGNDPPVAVNDSFSVDEDNTLTVSAPGVLVNDTDIDGDSLTAVLVTDVANGDLNLSQDGSFSYTPPEHFNGTVTFKYQANDGIFNSNIATVTITISTVNDTPVANDDSYETDEDITLNIPAPDLPGVLTNDADVEGDQLTAILVDDIDPTEGTLTFRSSGSFVYEPAEHFNGTVTFTYLVNDGEVNSNTATVTITVNPVNDAPVVGDIPDQQTTKGSTFQSINLDDYVTDADNDISDLIWTHTENSNITITIDSVMHVATIDIIDSLWDGSAEITFTATDPDGLSDGDKATFTIVQRSKLPAPQTDTVPGTYTASSLEMNLYVPGYPEATIYYNYTTDGTEPINPKSDTAEIINGSGLVDFGTFTEDTVIIILLAYASEYPYEDSDIGRFEYILAFPQLPAPVSSLPAGDYDTTQQALTLSVPGHEDAVIYYTIDGTDPETSSTRIQYTSGSQIVLGPYTEITNVTVSVYAEKEGYKPSSGEFEYNFNPQKLPKPVADPPGHTFYTDSVSVTLSVPGESDVEIRYTLDGSTPDANSNIYNDSIPIVIDGNTTLKAIALREGNLTGPVMTEVYIKSVPTSLEIYPDVDAEDPYPATITASAGTPVPLVSRIFDQFDTRLTQYETDESPISWRIQEVTGSNTGSLENTSGYMTSFMPVKAYNTVKVIATFERNGIKIEEAITIIIEPGEPYKLWLEADYSRLVSPNAPNEVTLIQLSSTNQRDTIYAIIRDSLGNYITTSKSTEWLPDVGSIATVEEGRANNGEGVVIKGTDSGNVIVTAENMDLNLPFPIDSVLVNVLEYWYDSLRIVVENLFSNAIDTLIMNTNLDTALQVFGHRDDNLEPAWESIPAKWEILDPQLEFLISAPPRSAHEWRLSPTDTASGRIRVTLDNDAVTIPDTVWVHFTPGPPTRMEFEVITEPEDLIAGNTITTVIRLYNDDNKLVYGNYCFPGYGDSAIYSDILDNGGRIDPVIIVDDSTSILSNTGTSVSECIETTGIDTVLFVLYYAPYDQDSLHQLNVTLSSTLYASTEPFRLLPGPVDSIEILVDNEPVDSIRLYTNSGTYFETIGYDRYGNFVGSVPSNWETTDTIPEITFPNATRQIYYTVPELLYETDGYIYARYVDDSTVADSVYVIIEAKPAELTKAVTLDENGNGYLDAIELTFDKNIKIPDDYDLSSIAVYYEEKMLYFTVDSISTISDSAGNERYILHLAENKSLGLPQTDWTPQISLDGINDVSVIEDFTTEDGAGPVVWKVVKKTGDLYDPSKDVVTVTFSEDFEGPDGQFMDADPKPSTVFYVWTMSDTGLIILDSVFIGIENFEDKQDNILFFKMSNGVDLNGNHYLSISNENNLVSDLFGNPPIDDNRKVNVTVIGKLGDITIGPNPMIPSLKYYNMEKDKPLEHIEPHEAYNRVMTTGGVMISVDIQLTLDEYGNIVDSAKIKAKLMIFDAVGNLVHEKKNEVDVIPDEWKNRNYVQGEIKQLCFYWDGVTKRGMKSAPGCYRVIVWINSNGEKKKSVGTVAVGR